MSLHYQCSISVSLPAQVMKLARQALPPTKSFTKKTGFFKFFIRLILISSGVKGHLKTKEDNACLVDTNSFNKLNH